MNMFLLWQLGQLLESAMGRIRFTSLYFLCMIGGAIGALILEPNALTGGASGAVFGLMAAAAVGLHQRGINPNWNWHNLNFEPSHHFCDSRHLNRRAFRWSTDRSCTWLRDAETALALADTPRSYSRRYSLVLRLPFSE
jgi:hypothetical protein